MLNSILANVVAGLGLFFSGLRMVDAHLRQATGRQLRMIIGRLTRSAWIAGCVGVVTGALVQSSSGIVFILVSLVSSGLTTVRRALPIVTWANVGCSVLIFAAVLDLRVAILYLVGVAGAAFAFDRSHRRDALGAVFGVGMLFYGIELMKTGSEPLKGLPWLPELLSGGQQSYVLAFVGGAAFSFVTQSATAVSIVVIGFAQTGLIGPFPTMMAIYGANVGSTFARMALSSTLKGSLRQLTAFQDLFKLSGAVVFVVMLYIEVREGVPLVYAAVSHVAHRVDRQMACVFLLFNLATAVVFSFAQRPILHWLERWLPADEDEDLSKPEFLYDEALNEPATALDLIDLEQLRLARRLRLYIDAIRGGPDSVQSARAEHVHEPFTAVASRIGQFQHDLVHQQLGPHETERLTKYQTRLSLIVYVEDSLKELVASAYGVPPGRLGELLATFAESLDFVLMTMEDAIESKEGDTIEILVQITGDRGELVERIRREYLTGEIEVTNLERAALLQATTGFERVIWMVQRVARLIEQREPAGRPPLTASSRPEPTGTARGASMARV